jgi:crotonobetainyl-CoA:carnitine CoA-transferase CaiB-like acyl-CoA transferase
MLPLRGVRVLDLTNVLAGPFCGYQLARLGAEVLKIENPEGGDLARRLGADPEMARRELGLSFVAVNAGKQSIALDLKDPRGKELFLELAATADVVLENFRPGVMKRLGLDYPALAARNPRLVYCAISGFGQTGPWADRPAYDQIVQGLAGVMSITGDEESAPLRVGLPLCDTVGGMTAAFAVAAALLEQRTTGRGRFIDVSLLESTLATMGWVVSNYLNAAAVPRPMGNENATAAPSGTFRTGDGLLNISANEQRQFEALCDLVGRPELKADPRFAERQERKRNRDTLRRLIEERLSERGAAEWEALLNAHGVPAGQVLSVPQILDHPQIHERRFVESLPVPGPGGEPLRVTRPGFKLDEELPLPGDPPALGADTRAWLRRLGRTDAEIDALALAGAIGDAGLAGPRAPAPGAAAGAAAGAHESGVAADLEPSENSAGGADEPPPQRAAATPRTNPARTDRRA